MKPLLILDNGHGEETPGKRSPVWPDKTQLFEWEFNRNIVNRIIFLLTGKVSCYTLVPEKTDISLGERCRRVNQIYKANQNAILISIHANAGGGTGWEAYTTPGTTKSDDLAEILYEEAKLEFPNEKIRMDLSDKDSDKEENFYILKNTNCPAVLTENFFMDTLKDCRLIQSETGRQRVAQFHAKAVLRYFGI